MLQDLDLNLVVVIIIKNRGGFVSRGGGSMNRGGRGRRRFNNKRFYYQLCGKPSHLADKCYHRFDKSFQRGPSQFQKYAQLNQRTNSGFQTKPQAYLAGPSEVNEVFMSDIGSSPSTYHSLSQFADV